MPDNLISQTFFSQTGPAVVDWVWLPVHSKSKGFKSTPTLVIPTLEIIASIPPGKGKCGALYISKPS
jgi:hypothetical protein